MICQLLNLLKAHQISFILFLHCFSMEMVPVIQGYDNLLFNYFLTSLGLVGFQFKDFHNNQVRKLFCQNLNNSYLLISSYRARLQLKRRCFLQQLHLHSLVSFGQTYLEDCYLFFDYYLLVRYIKDNLYYQKQLD